MDVDLNNAVSPLVIGKLREEFCALVDGETTQMPCIMEIGLSPTLITTMLEAGMKRVACWDRCRGHH